MPVREDGSTKSEPDTKLGEPQAGGRECRVSVANDVHLQLNSADDIRLLFATKRVRTYEHRMGENMSRVVPQSAFKGHQSAPNGQEKPKTKRKQNVTKLATTVCQEKMKEPSKEVKVGRIAKKRNKMNTVDKDKDSFYVGTLKNYSKPGKYRQAKGGNNLEQE